METAALMFNLRVPLGIDRVGLEESIGALKADAQLDLIEFTPAYRAEKNTPLVRAFLSAIRQAGGSPGFTVKSGTSDMNITAPIWRCPTLAYGPGDSDLDHTPHEHILVSEYQCSVRVLAQVLRAL